MIKLAFFLVKYLFSNKYRVIIAFSSKIDYLCFRVIQLCEVWGIRLIDFRNQFVTHPFLSLILQFVNQRDSLNGNNLFLVAAISEFKKLSDTKKNQLLISQGYRGIRVGWSSYQNRFYYGCQEKGWEFIFMHDSGREVAKPFNDYVREYIMYGDIETILKTHKKDNGIYWICIKI